MRADFSLPENHLKESTDGVLTIARFMPGRARKHLARAFAAASLAAALVVWCAGWVGGSATFDSATLAASKSMEAKLEILGSQGAPPSAPHSAVIVTEREANSYLKVHSGEFLPPGVRTPSLSVQPEHLTASGDVDFDALARSYPNPNDWGPKVLAAMFKGTQHVTVTGKVQSDNAGAHVQIERVVVGSMTVPNWLVDYVVQNVLQPRYKFDLNKPLPYPDHVTRIVLGSGQVTFLRSPWPGK